MRYSVDLDELESVTGSMKAFERTLEAKLAELDGLIEKLHGVWTGEAATAQQRAHDKIAQGVRDCHRALAELRAAGELAHQNYRAAGSANQQTWAATR